jgi:hypothetical protein
MIPRTGHENIVIGASFSVRAMVPVHEPDGIVPMRRLGEDRHHQNVWLASPEPAQSVVT